MRDVETGEVRPILKWAGGKRQLLPELRPFYPCEFDRFVEPFLGSAAVFLDLHNLGLLHDRRVVLSDINADVIGCYLAVRDFPGQVVKALRVLEADYKSGGAAHFRIGRTAPVRTSRIKELIDTFDVVRYRRGG